MGRQPATRDSPSGSRSVPSLLLLVQHPSEWNKVLALISQSLAWSLGLYCFALPLGQVSCWLRLDLTDSQAGGVLVFCAWFKESYSICFLEPNCHVGFFFAWLGWGESVYFTAKEKKNEFECHWPTSCVRKLMWFCFGCVNHNHHWTLKHSQHVLCLICSSVKTLRHRMWISRRIWE